MTTLQLEYELLPINTLLYRGVNMNKPVIPLYNSLYKWFMPDAIYAKIYGNVIYTYQTTKPLLLIKMNLNNIKYLLHMAESNNRDDVVNALVTSFNIIDNHIIRISEYETDATIMQYLCENNIQGYIATELPKNYEATNLFHPEIAICNPSLYMIELNNETIKTSIPPPVLKKKMVRQYNNSVITKRLFDD